MKWMLDRIGRLIAAYSQKPTSGDEAITPADPHQTDLVPSSEPRRSSERIEANFDAERKDPLSGFPAPEGFEARAMPTKNGLRLNHLGHAEQARPEPDHPYQERPITAAQSKTRRRRSQGNVELMTEKQVLSFRPPPRFEQVSNKHSERVQDYKHRAE